MAEKKERIRYPGPQAELGQSHGHRIPGDRACHEEKSRSFSKTFKLKTKRKFYIGTLNTLTLTKTGKIKQLTDILQKFNVKICALQETRFNDQKHFDTEGYRIFKGKPAITVQNTYKNNLKLFGTGFVVHKSIINSVTEFKSKSERLSILTIRCGNKNYTLINAHAPTNHRNKKYIQNTEDFWEDLEEIALKIPQQNIKILLGDFNAHLGRERKHRKITGPFTAHRDTNKNGERLINYCKLFELKIMSTQFEKPHKRLTTWRPPNNKRAEHQIDHIAISSRNHKEIMNVRNRKGFFDSDHHFLQIKVKFIPNRKQSANTQKNIRVDPEYLQINKEKISEEIKKIGINTNWTQLAKKTQELLKLGQAPRKRRHRWWNATCDKAIEDRLEAWKKFNSTKTTENWQRFCENRKNTAKTIRREKRAYDCGRLKEIEEDFNKNNTRNFYKTFREHMTHYNPPNLCFRKPDGTLETNTKNNCEILAQYFNTLLNCGEPTERLIFNNTTPTNTDSQAPTPQEITEIIKSLKNNKAPGEDGITAEIWKLDTKNITPIIHNIIKQCWETEKIPEEWKTALIHPLHKKGEKTDPNNYRGISLLPITYKILSKALLNRLEPQVNPQLGEYQGGFRRNRSCTEQIWNLRTILVQRKSNCTVVIFVDFKKAYDSVDRHTLFKTLKEFGVDRKTTNLIKQTLTDTTSKVKFMGEISEPFKIKTGVRQGDGLSPILFNTVLEKIIRTWENHTKGIGFKTGQGLTYIKCLAFADDIAILTKNREEAREALEKLHEIALKTGLQISYEKTQYIDTKSKDNLPLETQYGNITQLEEFKYLGETIQKSGANKTSNKERAQKLQKAYKLTWSLYNKKCISINAKLRHYNTVILPEALYAAETISLGGHSEMDNIRKIERKILRKIYGAVNREGIWMKRPTTELYKTQEDIDTQIRKRRAKFYCHIKRMDDSRLTKRVFDILQKNKNGRWFKEAEHDIRALNITEQDIRERKIVRNKLKSGTFTNKLEFKQKKTGTAWTEDRKKEHSERMKRFWEVKKKQQRKK